MKEIELELVNDEGSYAETFEGRWIISPGEEYKTPELYFDEECGGNIVPDSGKCCAVALKADGMLLFYVFHNNDSFDPLVVEYDSLEEVEKFVSDSSFIEEVRERLGL
jgi:hypothetical protein